MSDPSSSSIQSLVLDAGPLITQSATFLQNHAKKFFTTPGVHGELKDESARRQLLLWGDSLTVRHPRQVYINKVSAFAKLTGDYAVLSANDIHIVALAYELEVEANGDLHLRLFPGQQRELVGPVAAESVVAEGAEIRDGETSPKPLDEPVSEAQEETADALEEDKEEEEEWITPSQNKKRNSKQDRVRGGRRQREKREAELRGETYVLEKTLAWQKREAERVQLEEEQQRIEKLKILEDVEESTQDAAENAGPSDQTESSELDEDYADGDDDGEWITPENLATELLKDDNEVYNGAADSLIGNGSARTVALSTGDFACQNVAMQIGLNLMNAMLGMQIKRVRNYMYRCHACFRLTPIPKDGTPKHFCPNCGGATLLRCAVSVDTRTGRVTPHLKANFQWIRRGERYTLASPQSKKLTQKAGKAGYQHNKLNRHKSLQLPLILREDQPEYARAIKDDEWLRRQNEKALQEWTGGGSADNYMSPFGTHQQTRGVRVGGGRQVNKSRKR